MKEITKFKRQLVLLTDEVAKTRPNLSTDIVKTYLAIYKHLEDENKQLLEKVEKTKGMYFDNLQAKDNEIYQLLETVESLKCCGTCSYFVSGMITSCKLKTFEENKKALSRIDKCENWQKLGE